MRRNIPFILFLAALSAISGWLMSHMSWIGRIGVNLFHKEYKFLKTWYKGGGLVFAVLLLLFFLQFIAQRKWAPVIGVSLQLLALIFAICGLWLTYSDFGDDFTHSILRERFHLGAYLFWIGWMSVSLYVLTMVRQKSPFTSAGRTGQAMP